MATEASLLRSEKWTTLPILLRLAFKVRNNSILRALHSKQAIFLTRHEPAVQYFHNIIVLRKIYFLTSKIVGC